MTDAKSFIIETFRRLGQKSPAIFRVWGNINMILLLAGAIPKGLQQLQEIFNGAIDFSAILPQAPWVNQLWYLLIGMGTMGKIMASITITSNHEIVEDVDGALIQKPCGDLPFTEKKESMKIVEPKKI